MSSTAKKKGNGTWTEEEDRLLAHWNTIVGNKWSEVAKHILGKTGQQCAQRWRHRVNPAISREKWTDEEDRLLSELVEQHGSAWAEIARHLPGRTDQQCMGRWRRHLDPSINRDSWTPAEDDSLRELVAEYGTSWSCISKSLEGRTAQQCRARWCQLSNAESSRSRSSTLQHNTSSGGGSSQSGSRSGSRSGKRRSGARRPAAAPAGAAVAAADPLPPQVAAPEAAADPLLHLRRQSTANTQGPDQPAPAADAEASAAPATALAPQEPAAAFPAAAAAEPGSDGSDAEAGPPPRVRAQRRRQRLSTVSEVATNEAAAGGGSQAHTGASLRAQLQAAVAVAVTPAAPTTGAGHQADMHLPKAEQQQQQQQVAATEDDESPALTHAASQLAFLSPSHSGAPLPPAAPLPTTSERGAAAAAAAPRAAAALATPSSAGRKRAAGAAAPRMAAFAASVAPLAVPGEAPATMGTKGACTPMRGPGSTGGSGPLAGLLLSPNLATLLQSPQVGRSSDDPFKSPGFGSMVTPPWAKSGASNPTEMAVTERRQSVARRLDSAPSFAYLAVAGEAAAPVSSAAAAGAAPAAHGLAHTPSFDFGVVGSPSKKARTAGAAEGEGAPGAAAAAVAAAALGAPWLGGGGGSPALEAAAAAVAAVAAATPWLAATGNHLLQPESVGRTALALAVEQSLLLASVAPLDAAQRLQQQQPAQAAGKPPTPAQRQQLTSSSVRLRLHALLEDTA